jgi:WD40 repeat protein
MDVHVQRWLTRTRHGKPGVEYLFEIPGREEPQYLHILPNRGKLMCVDVQTRIFIWDLNTKQLVVDAHCIKHPISCASTTAYLPFLALGAANGIAYFFSVPDGQLHPISIQGNNCLEKDDFGRSAGKCCGVDFNPRDPNEVAVGFDNGYIVRYDLTSQKLLTLFGEEDTFKKSKFPGLSALCWHPDGKTVVAGYSSGEIYFWEVKKPKKPAKKFTISDEKNRLPVKRLFACFNEVGKPVYLILGGGSAAEPMQVTYLKDGEKGRRRILRVEEADWATDFVVARSHPDIRAMIPIQGIFMATNLGTVCWPASGVGPPALIPPEIQSSPITILRYDGRPCPVGFIKSLKRLTPPTRLEELTNVSGVKSRHVPPSVQDGQSVGEGCLVGGKLVAKGVTPSLAVSGHLNGELKFWDVGGPNLMYLGRWQAEWLLPPPGDAAIATIVVEPAARMIAFSCFSGEVYLVVGAPDSAVKLDLGKGEESEKQAFVQCGCFMDHVGNIPESLALSSQWGRLAVGDENGLISVYNIRTGLRLLSIKVGQRVTAMHLAAVPLGRGDANVSGELIPNLYVGTEGAALLTINLKHGTADEPIRFENDTIISLMAVNEHARPSLLAPAPYTANVEEFVGDIPLNAKGKLQAKIKYIPKYLVVACEKSIRIFTFDFVGLTPVDKVSLPSPALGTNLCYQYSENTEVIETVCMVTTHEDYSMRAWHLFSLQPMYEYNLQRFGFPLSEGCIATSTVGIDGRGIFLTETSELLRTSLFQRENKLDLPANLPSLFVPGVIMPPVIMGDI